MGTGRADRKKCQESIHTNGQRRNVLHFEIVSGSPACKTAWQISMRIELKMPVIELRPNAVFERTPRSRRSISGWRKNTPNSILSLHTTNLEAEDNSFLEKSVEAAIRLGCQRVTLHVPVVTAKRFSSVQEKLTEHFLRICSSLLQRNIAIGIENLHTRPPDELSDDTRNYGCTIEECKSWIQHLQQATNSTLIGFHLDIGHARNNIPFSSEEYVSDWYTQLGALINGIHLHQVRLKNDGSSRITVNLPALYKTHFAIRPLPRIPS